MRPKYSFGSLDDEYLWQESDVACPECGTTVFPRPVISDHGVDEIKNWKAECLECGYTESTIDSKTYPEGWID